jgi:broad specificity phosphatase PhoE
LEEKQKTKRLQLFLLRHAEVDDRSEFIRIRGRSNSLPLSKRGEAQAIALAKRFNEVGTKFDLVYTSPAQRAHATAKIVCELIGFNKEILLRDELQELSRGDWEGADRGKTYTDEVRAQMSKYPDTFRAPNGESHQDVMLRMKSDFVEGELFNILKKQERTLTVAVFGHGVAFKCLLFGILESKPSLTYKMTIDNCSITELKFMDGGDHPGWHLIRFNDRTHIESVGFTSASYGDVIS